MSARLALWSFFVKTPKSKMAAALCGRYIRKYKTYKISSIKVFNNTVSSVLNFNEGLEMYRIKRCHTVAATFQDGRNFRTREKYSVP